MHSTPITTTPGKSYSINRISFWLNGKELSAEIPPAQTTLAYLHQSQQLFGTKCSCNEGDCGACTVVVASAREGKVAYEAVNSCLYNAAKLHGKHLITIESLGTPESLHPIQSAMLELHATQCGYCTPGFVMSMFALFATHANPSDERVLAVLEGNLCRCTGYDSILKAARRIARDHNPQDIVPDWCRALEPEILSFARPRETLVRESSLVHRCQRYEVPSSLAELASALADNEPYTLINGGTDIMVQMNVRREEFPRLVDIGGLDELRGIALHDAQIRIGANSTYTDVLNSPLLKDQLPQLPELVGQIASEQIRDFGTLAGNIANASPIGDTLPLLLVLDAVLELFSQAGTRQLPLREFFIGYRQTELKQGEIIAAILIPLPPKYAFIRFVKAAKRKAVDISSVVSAVRLETSAGVFKRAELAFGGVAPVPRLSLQFYRAMLNMEPQGIHPGPVADFVAREFEPISDVRGSKEYRSLLIRNHVFKYLNEFLRGEGK